jgi:O-antigen/teichoic acid export membrane protein
VEPAALTPTVTRRRAAADVFAQLGGQILNLALGVIVTLLVVRTLGTTSFGQWSTILAVTQIVALFANLGLGNVTIQRAAADPEHQQEWIGSYVSLTAAITVPLTLLSMILLLALSTSAPMRIASLVMSGTLLLNIASTVSLVFRLHVRNHVTVIFTTAKSVLWGAGVIAIHVLGGGMVALALAFLASSAVVQACESAYALRVSPIRLRGSRARWGALASVGIGVGIGTIITVAYGRIDQILVFELAPNHADAGIYGAIYRILDQAGFAPAALMTTLFPLISAAHPADPARVRRLVQFAIDNLVIVSLPVFAFSLVAARPLIDLLFGTAFQRGAPALPVLMAAYVAICFGYVAGYLAIVTVLQRKFIVYSLLGLVVNVTMNLLLIPSTGFEGAAWATLVTEALVVILQLTAAFKVIGLRPSTRRPLTIALAATLAGAAVWGLRQSNAPVLAMAALMLVLYPILLLAFGALDIRELRRLAGARASGSS